MGNAERTPATFAGRGRLAGMLALNAALLAGLALVTFAPRADAQRRAQGEYTMIGGSVKGSSSSALYIVDTVNEEMIALTYEPSQQELIGVGYRHLAADAAASTGGANR